MNLNLPFLWACLATLMLSACAHRESVSTSPGNNATVQAASAAATDQWLGQWNGPEGTFLRLAGGDGKYQVTIQNLDGPRNYPGSSVDGTIRFQREGVTESIRSTNGEQTGMKWLADKTNCLTVRLGEGYCRS